MVDYLRATYRDRIQKLDWMDEPTRREALAKLDKIASYIGFPDRWHDRSAVRIAPDDLVGMFGQVTNEDGTAGQVQPCRVMLVRCEAFIVKKRDGNEFTALRWSPHPDNEAEAVDRRRAAQEPPKPAAKVA
jgi:hypothetical protein